MNDELPSGRELDARILAAFCGWRWVQSPDGLYWLAGPRQYTGRHEAAAEGFWPAPAERTNQWLGPCPPSPSTSPVNGDELMGQWEGRISLNRGGGEWCCELREILQLRNYFGSGATKEEAFCRAILESRETRNR